MFLFFNSMHFLHLAFILHLVINIVCHHFLKNIKIYNVSFGEIWFLFVRFRRLNLQLSFLLIWFRRLSFVRNLVFIWRRLYLLIVMISNLWILFFSLKKKNFLSLCMKMLPHKLDNRPLHIINFDFKLNKNSGHFQIKFLWKNAYPPQLPSSPLPLPPATICTITSLNLATTKKTINPHSIGLWRKQRGDNEPHICMCGYIWR